MENGPVLPPYIHEKRKAGEAFRLFKINLNTGMTDEFPGWDLRSRGFI
jgi:hypothetical protein